QCGKYSEGREVTVPSGKSVPDVTLSVVHPQTACIAPYNGQLTATPEASGNYDYAWYRGTVTSGPSAVLVGNSQTTPDTLGTDVTDVYTLVFTDNSSGCDTTVSITLPEDINPPVLNTTDALITPLTSCDPSNPNGAIEVSVGGNTADYTFRLYEGTNITPPYVEATDGIFNDLGVLNKDQKYTIEAISTLTGCATVDALTVTVEDN